MTAKESETIAYAVSSDHPRCHLWRDDIWYNSVKDLKQDRPLEKSNEIVKLKVTIEVMPITESDLDENIPV